MSDHPIAVYRRARGLSLRTLGAATRIPYVKLHHAEHGRALDAEDLAKIARALGVDVSAIQTRPELDHQVAS